MRLWPLSAVLAAIVGISANQPASGQSIGVEPLFLEVAPNESSALRVRNSSDKPVTIEVLVEERAIDENGVQTRTDAEDDFILFPPQAVVPASSLQVFRLQPITPDLKQSKSYFVTVKQVPVKLPEIEGGGARLQLVFAFDAAVHVVPRGAKPEAVLVGAAPDRMTIQVATGTHRTADDGSQVPEFRDVEVPAIAVTMRNDGNKYFYLQDLQLDGDVTGPAGKTALPKWTQEEVIKAVKLTLVPPGATRKFKLPLPEGQTPTAVNLTANLRGNR